MAGAGTIHHIEINVSDLDRSVRFWEWLLTEKLGYIKFQTWDKGVSFKLSDTYIVFVQTEQNFADRPFHRKGTGLNHIAFHCSDRNFVETLTKELKEKNIKILYTERHLFAAGKDSYAVFFEDPDRIKVEVVVKIP